MNTPTLGILMLLASFGLVTLGVGAMVLARLRGRPVRVRTLMAGAAGWGIVYAAALISSSLTSHEQLLGRDEDKRFCGFYLDCHLQVAVTRVDTARALGTGDRAVRAEGVFYILTLRVSSTAVAAQLQLLDPRLSVRDRSGRVFTRHAAAESTLAARGAPAESLTRPLAAGETFTTTVAFDVPAGAPAPRLSVTEGIWAERLVELILIGDEDSFLHKRTMFELRT